MQIIRTAVTRSDVREIAQERFGDMVKAVVDCERKIMAIAGQLHSDEEQALLEDGSQQENLWGINIYPDKPETEWIEFDSMINLRPRDGNRSRGVDDPILQETIRSIVSQLIQ